MRAIDRVRDYLGEPYEITVIDREDVIYRDLKNGYEFEVSGVSSETKNYVLYVWRTTDHREIVGIYKDIKGKLALKDVLGHYAFTYQNLSGQIQVEREE